MTTGTFCGVTHMKGAARFNLSNDEYYQNSGNSKLRQKLGKAIMAHSLPALRLNLVKMHWSTHDKRYFHRPLTLFPIGGWLNIVRITLRRRDCLHTGPCRPRRYQCAYVNRPPPVDALPS